MTPFNRLHVTLCSRSIVTLAVACTFSEIYHDIAANSRQSARMSKITNDGLTRSGTRCFIAVPI